MKGSQISYTFFGSPSWNKHCKQYSNSLTNTVNSDRKLIKPMHKRINNISIAHKSTSNISLDQDSHQTNIFI